MTGTRTKGTFKVWMHNLENKLCINADYSENDKARMAYIERRVAGTVGGLLVQLSRA
jgi:hypothetical protein